MAYSKTQWDEQTSITPERLNKVEDGIEEAHSLPTDADTVMAIRTTNANLKVAHKVGDPDPSDSDNEGLIYLRTDL